MGKEQADTSFLWLQQEDIIAAGGADVPKAVGTVENTYRMLALGEIKLPVKTVMMAPLGGVHEMKYLMVAMPSYINTAVPITGLKWATESIDNDRRGDLPYGVDVLILHDMERAIPFAIMDASMITATRTGAAVGVITKHFAKKDPKVAGIIGAGVCGRRAIEAIGHAAPSIKEFRVYDKVGARSELMAKKFGERWKIVPCDSAEKAADGVDVIASQTTTHDAPFVKGEWLKPGGLYVHTGVNEGREDIFLAADKLYSDEPEMFEKYPDKILAAALLNDGRLPKDAFKDIGSVIAGKIPGRTSDKEKIVVIPFGIGCVDLIIAKACYDRAKEIGKGTKLKMWNRTDLVLDP